MHMSRKTEMEQGYVNSWMIVAISAIVLFVAAGSAAIWAYLAYSQEKTAVESRMAVASAKAREEQSKADREYPKTWSVYVAADGGDRGDYKAYLHPVIVPPTNTHSSNQNKFALRLEILNSDFNKTLDQYASLLKKGDLTSSSVEYNGNTATRIDGAFSKDLRGSVVLMKVRDKTLRFSTDADTFKPDFEAILKTVKFVQ